MRLYFHTPEFDSQFLRALSYTWCGAADIGECFSTALQIKEPDFDSWYQEWKKTADRLYALAEGAYENGGFISARETYLRASNYYRASGFFYYSSPVHPKLVESYDLHVYCFAQSMKFLRIPVQKIQIPYETTSLPGYFYKCDHSVIPRPTLIINTGYDGTCQESFFSLAPAALQRGYHVLTFDGPGQGEMLIKHQIPMRHDWEFVITPIMDWLQKRHDVDNHRIALLGNSWGGMLTARAAAFEKRLAALIVNPGQFEALQTIRKIFPEIDKILEDHDKSLLKTFLGHALKNKLFAQKFQARMFVHGLGMASDLIHEWGRYHLEDIAPQINCPTLVCDCENESLSPEQAKRFFDALSCPKEYCLFKNTEGAGEHCVAGALTLFHFKLFNWLDKVLHPLLPTSILKEAGSFEESIVRQDHRGGLGDIK